MGIKENEAHDLSWNLILQVHSMNSINKSWLLISLKGKCYQGLMSKLEDVSVTKGARYPLFLQSNFSYCMEMVGSSFQQYAHKKAEVPIVNYVNMLMS